MISILAWGVLFFLLSRVGQSNQDIITEINKHRSNLQLTTLRRSKKLENIALMRAKNLAKLGFLSHEGYQEYFSAFQIQGLVGENLAKNFNSNKQLVLAWMNSPSHRDNILGDYQYVGVANYKGYVVASFSFSK